jgi:hypothetical protein
LYKFSSSKAQGSGSTAGFKSQMAERVLRQFEAARDKPEVVAVRTVQLRLGVSSSVPLRPALQAASIEVTRPALLLSRSSFSRSFAFSLETPRSVLSKLMPQLKRAASACLFQRLSERLALIHPRQVPVRQSSLRQSSLRQSSLRQSSVSQSSVRQSVASRLQ